MADIIIGNQKMVFRSTHISTGRQLCPQEQFIQLCLKASITEPNSDYLTPILFMCKYLDFCFWFPLLMLYSKDTCTFRSSTSLEAYEDTALRLQCACLFLHDWKTCWNWLYFHVAPKTMALEFKFTSMCVTDPLASATVVITVYIFQVSYLPRSISC